MSQGVHGHDYFWTPNLSNSFKKKLKKVNKSLDKKYLSNQNLLKKFRGTKNEIWNIHKDRKLISLKKINAKTCVLKHCVASIFHLRKY